MKTEVITQHHYNLLASMKVCAALEPHLSRLTQWFTQGASNQAILIYSTLSHMNIIIIIIIKLTANPNKLHDVKHVI